MPLGALLLSTGSLVLPGFAGGNSDVGHGHAAWHGPCFRIGAQIADQNDFVYASSQCPTPATILDPYCTRRIRPYIRAFAVQSCINRRPAESIFATGLRPGLLDPCRPRGV